MTGAYTRERPPPLPEVGNALSERVEPYPFATEPPPPWYLQPYKGGPMVPLPGFPRPLYPPDAAAQGKQPSTAGPDVVAYKRTIARLGRWPWNPPSWDEKFSNGFSHGRSPNVRDTGVEGVQRQAKITPESGWIGKQTFNLLRSARVPDDPQFVHTGEMAMDAPAQNLLEEAWFMFGGQPAANESTRIRNAMTDYCQRCIAQEPGIHYQQLRPIGCFGVSPEHGFTTDCSGHATCVYYWARKMTGLPVPDPNGNGYSGYGWTGTLWDWNAGRQVAGGYQVGDLALYGSGPSSATTHVVTCYQAGDAKTARWCSHGSEAAPYSVELWYRADMVGVVRPPLQ